MTCKYLDPYKEDKYGKLKGSKSEQYFKVTFSEAKVFKTDDAYIIAANVTNFSGLVRGYKPEQTLTPGLCAIPIYGKEYGIRKKGSGGVWTEDKFQPSLFEKALYDKIAANESDWLPEGKAIRGAIAHLPNEMLAGNSPEQLKALVSQNAVIDVCDLTGALPEYTPPFSGNYSKGGGKSYGMSPEQRIAFLKKQLAEDVTHPEFKEGKTLAELTNRMLQEHHGDEAFIAVYFDMLIVSVK